MIIDCIGCLHGTRPELEGGDLLIVTGDLTARDESEQYDDFFTWLYDQNYTKKVLICGNHDNLMKETSPKIIRWAEKGTDICDYLCDSGTKFVKFRSSVGGTSIWWDKFKIWGSPWTSQFPGINPKCCAFTRPYKESLQDRWDLIPDDVDILITHTPPYGILDGITQEDGNEYHVGDKALLEALESRIKPKLHVFSHIHEQGGKQMIFKRSGHGDENNTICVNASIMSTNYTPDNDPVRIIL